jgi:Flp pilus assembly protein protease CpaA
MRWNICGGLHATVIERLAVVEQKLAGLRQGFMQVAIPPQSSFRNSVAVCVPFFFEFFEFSAVTN